jgi:hypothetical protein
MDLAGRTVNIASLEIEGVDSCDYPDFCDAQFSYGIFEDGDELTDDELEELTDLYGDVVNMMAHDCCIGAAEDRYDYLRDR